LGSDIRLERNDRCGGVQPTYLKMQKTVAIALPEEPDTAVKRFPRELLYLCTILLMLVALVAGYCFWVMSKLPM